MSSLFSFPVESPPVLFHATIIASVGNDWVINMKTEWFKMRISKRRMDILRSYSALKDKSMTQVLEECIDSLSVPEKEHVTESAHDSVSPQPKRLKYEGRRCAPASQGFSASPL